MIKIVVKSVFCSLLVLTIFLGGCQSLSRNNDQQVRKYSRVSDLNRRMLAEDLDKILLLDRPSRLTEWHVIAD